MKLTLRLTAITRRLRLLAAGGSLLFLSSCDDVYRDAAIDGIKDILTTIISEVFGVSTSLFS